LVRDLVWPNLGSSQCSICAATTRNGRIISVSVSVGCPGTFSAQQVLDILSTKQQQSKQFVDPRDGTSCIEPGTNALSGSAKEGIDVEVSAFHGKPGGHYGSTIIRLYYTWHN
jgi:hypothetical protein